MPEVFTSEIDGCPLACDRDNPFFRPFANYAYSVLEAHVRIGAIADGYDPARGMLHSRVDPDSQSFVFDMMEPLRSVVDRAVLKLVRAEAFSGADFILQQNGVCHLSPELARRVVHGVNLELRVAG